MLNKEKLKLQLDMLSKELAKLVGYLESEIDIEKEQAQALKNNFKVIKINDKKQH